MLRTIPDESPADGVSDPTGARGEAGPTGRALVIGPSGAEGDRLREALADVGLEVHECPAPGTAEDLVTRYRPDLVLARWDLVSDGGRELVRRLEGRATTEWVPLILHGGRPTAEERAEAMELGAFDVLSPLPPAAELRARLCGAVRVRRRMALLERRAYRDGLTGLINRGALEDQLLRQWEASRRHKTSLSVLIVDLDRFKEINDTHGHAAGDAALRRVAAVLMRSVRSSDIVARYGGDEFVVVAPACPPTAAVLLAARFRAALAAPREASAVPLTLSIGIAGNDGSEPTQLDELLLRADQALYHAKRAGRDAAALFDPVRGAPALILSP